MLETRAGTPFSEAIEVTPLGAPQTLMLNRFRLPPGRDTWGFSSFASSMAQLRPLV